jgi:protein involved in polysaccharide export with SLBB domain/beta-lactamase regulating signal transducer with metallopeptidase domain
MTIGPFNDVLIRAIGLTLLHFVWQGALVAALFGAALLLLRRRSANARYLAGCAAMLLLAAAPLATFVYLQRSATPRPPAAATYSPSLPEPSVSQDLHIGTMPLAVANVAVNDPAPSRSVEPQSAVPSPLHVIDRALPWCVAAWGGGVLVLSVRMLGGWMQLQRVRRRGTQPAPLQWTARMAALARRMGVPRAVRLLECARVDCPAVVGWIRPVILLPASAMSGLSVAQLESILAHELAHVRRHDYLINLFQSALETVLFYHPAVWWVSRRVRQERENGCDDIAAAVCGDRVMYAAALATLEELRPVASRFAIAAHGGVLLPRIRRLLGRPAPDPARAGWWPGAAAALLILAALAATLHVSHTTNAAAPASNAAPATNPSADLTPHEIAALDNGYIGPYLQKLDTLRVDLKRAKSRFGEKHRMVQAIQSDIDLTSEWIGIYAHNFNKSFAGTRAVAPKPPLLPTTAETSPVQPEDLDPSELSGRIGPGDMLNISIRDLMGPGLESASPQRVAPDGTVTLPLVGAIEATGKTAAELQTAISRTYHEAKIAIDLPVSVTVTESASQMFSVLGAVNRSGRYPLPRADFRLIEALAAAGGLKDDAERVFVVRRPQKPGVQGRTLAIPIEPLLRGDLAMNVVIRPGDVIMAPSPMEELREAQVSRAAAALGRSAATQPRRPDFTATAVESVEAVAERQRELAERLESMRELGPAHPQVVASRQQLERAQKQLSEAIAQREWSSGSYYISGVAKPGAYQLDGPMTVLQALVAAEYDIARGGGQHVMIVSSSAGDPAARTRSISIIDLMGAPEKAPPIRRGDLIIVRDGPPTTQPVPPSGGVYYLGGQIQSPGAYEITSPITVLDALIAARLQPEAGKELYVTLIRGVDNGKQEVHTMKVSDLLASHGPIMHVQAADRIMVSDKPPTTQLAH